MKKLLVLLVVLGMASLAAAAPTMSVSPTTVITGGTITVTVSGSATEASDPLDPLVGGYSGLVWEDIVGNSYGTSNLLDLTSTPVATTYAGGMAWAGTSYNQAKFTAASSVPWTEGTDVDAGLWFTYSFTAGNSTGTTSIDLLDSDYNLVGGQSVPITIVPEPLTMTLLGLGGLGLLRRRRA